MNQIGALPSQVIRKISKLSHVTCAGKTVLEDNIQPASLDLTLSDKGWCVKSTFLPRTNEKIEDAINRYKLYDIDLSSPVVLNTGVSYILKLNEEFNLDKSIYGYSSPKSSSGRINLWVRTLADNVPRFDKIPYGYKGPLYILVSASSWPVQLEKDISLNQMMFFNGHNTLSDFELKLVHQESGLLFDDQENKITSDYLADNGLLLTADLSSDIIAYKAKSTVGVLDLSKKYHYDLNDFFMPIYKQKDEEIVLEKNGFYLLSSNERISVPPDYAVEMVAYDISSGEFRSHYAGFFDPGFGYSKKKEISGRQAVLEVCPHETFILRHKQPVCKMIYEYMVQVPDKIYGQDTNSHYYLQQGPQLGKYFKKIKNDNLYKKSSKIKKKGNDEKQRF